jgi:hypothetical protein
MEENIESRRIIFYQMYNEVIQSSIKISETELEISKNQNLFDFFGKIKKIGSSTNDILINLFLLFIKKMNDKLIIQENENDIKIKFKKEKFQIFDHLLFIQNFIENTTLKIIFQNNISLYQNFIPSITKKLIKKIKKIITNHFENIVHSQEIHDFNIQINPYLKNSVIFEEVLDFLNIVESEIKSNKGNYYLSWTRNLPINGVKRIKIDKKEEIFSFPESTISESTFEYMCKIDEIYQEIKKGDFEISVLNDMFKVYEIVIKDNLEKEVGAKETMIFYNDCIYISYILFNYLNNDDMSECKEIYNVFIDFYVSFRNLSEFYYKNHLVI